MNCRIAKKLLTRQGAYHKRQVARARRQTFRRKKWHLQDGEPIVFLQMTVPTSFEGFQKEMDEQRTRFFQSTGIAAEYFTQQYQQQPSDVKYCRCGHAEDEHREHPPRERRLHGFGYCRAQGPRICDCGGFIAAGEGSEHMMRCRACALPFDRQEIDQVIAHEHRGPHEATGIPGRKL